MSAPRPSQAAPDRAALLADLRGRVFAPQVGAGAVERIGAEVELIPLCSDTGAPVPLNAPDGLSLLPLLRRHAAGRGWIEEPTPYGAPQFRVAGGGCVFFEPGGQLEFSTAPCHSAAALLASLRRAMLPLILELRSEGIDLVAAGIDPFNPLDRVPMQLGGARYTRMAAHLARFGPAGGRMMRQTAAFQLNVDFGAEPGLRWRVLNAAASYLLAIFANSPRYAGRATGHRSFRAACWRRLDPARTGLLPCTGDPAEEYLEFALGAPAILKCPPDGEDHQPFREWLARGRASHDDWLAHLSTLFPEVRPKGFIELRSLDAVAPEWWAAPVVLVAAILRDPRSLRAAADLLGAPDAGLLHPAGQVGLADPGIARTAGELVDLGMAAAVRATDGFVRSEDVDAAQEFFDRYTRRGRSPADDVRDPPADLVPATLSASAR